MIKSFIKPVNRNPRYTSLIRKGEARIRDFAKCHGLPIVEIDGLPRPVLASGLWNPIFHLIGVDHDRDGFDLDTSVGFGHLVGPNERSTSLAADYFASLDWSDESDREWTHTNYLLESSKCRNGALILAADLLRIPIRHFDASMMSVELLLPPMEANRPKKRIQASSKRLLKGQTNGY